MIQPPETSRMMYSTAVKAAGRLYWFRLPSGLKFITRKMPLTIWITSTRSASEPK